MTQSLATGTVPTYPVRITAPPRPDHPSRGLWLVKWLLVIPHVVVLALLWAAFVVLSAVALVAILATGRYPRTIFDFNVGVLRWTWRVAYYSYGALGTDRYPPFTVNDVPDYPARLEVDYPEQLSRGKALVKWWLLALPHYLIVAAASSTAWSLTGEFGRDDLVVEVGLVGVLATVVGFSLLFTGRYPLGLYDVLLGINRWMLRVAGYAALMTDTYPPFRLDQGASAEPQDAPAAPVTMAPRPAGQWTAGLVTTVVGGALGVLLGLGLTTAGGVLLATPQDGYITSPAVTVHSSGYAVATEPLLLDGTAVDEVLGQVRVRAETTDGQAVFVGIAEARDAQTYLAGVQHTVITGTFPLDERQVSGGAPGSLPQQSGFWQASAIGPGVQTIELDTRPGSWVVVLMSADGGAGVHASVDVASTLPWLRPAGGGLLTLGMVLLVAGGGAIALGVRVASAREQQ